MGTTTNIVVKLRTNAQIADARRRNILIEDEIERWAGIERRRYRGEPRYEFRQPVVRRFGVASGARERLIRPRARPEVLAISWLVLLLLAVGFCSAAFWL